MGSKGMTWDAAADRKLFLGILKTQNVSVDNEAMSKYMSTDGVVCTPSAIQNRVRKLKAMVAKDGNGEGSPGSDDGDGSHKTKGKAAGRKRAATATAEDDEEETPIKKLKGKGGKAKKAVGETESDDGDGADGAESIVKEEEAENGEEA